MSTQKVNAKKIAEHADANRWTANSIATATGLASSTVWNILKGKAEPSATNLKAICDTIGLSVEEVFITEAEAAA